MTQDEQLDETVRRALDEMEPPPAVPRDLMWARIEAQRGMRSAARAGRTRRALRWGAALAATLVVGIALGRESVRRAVQGRVSEPGPAAETPVAGAATGVPIAYRVAAVQHLQETEALFASLVLGAPDAPTAEVSDWARSLLRDTRLLLGSPAARDPALGALLADLELLLSQIAMIPEARAREEVELIQEGIDQSDVLLRLRVASAGSPRASAEGRADR